MVNTNAEGRRDRHGLAPEAAAGEDAKEGDTYKEEGLEKGQCLESRAAEEEDNQVY